MKSVLNALLISICAGPVFGYDLADLIEKAEPSCVRIDVQLKDGGRSIGSGFVVDAVRKWVVTNYHVVADSKAATVSFPDGTKAEVEGWRAHYVDYDLALLQIKTDKRLTALALAPQLPRKGEKTVAIGTPQGLSFTATEGIISAIRDGGELLKFIAPDSVGEKDPKKQLKGKWLQTSTPISPGSSGGPLLDMQGDVVGVNSGSLVSAQNINFAVSCLQIKELVDVARRIRLRELSILTPSAGTWLSDRPSAEESSAEVVVTIPPKKRYRHGFRIESEEDEFDQVTVLRTPWLPVKHANRALTSLGVRVSIVFDKEEVMPLALWEVGATARSFQFLGRDKSRFQILAGEES